MTGKKFELLRDEELTFFKDHLTDEPEAIKGMTIRKYLNIARIMYEAVTSYPELSDEEVYCRCKCMGKDECAWSERVYQYYRGSDKRFRNSDAENTGDLRADEGFFAWLLEHRHFGYHFEELYFGKWDQYLMPADNGIVWKWLAKNVHDEESAAKTIRAFNALVRQGYHSLLINAEEVYHDYSIFTKQ